MEQSSQTARHFAIAAGALGLLIGGMWVANQGGLWPSAAGMFAGSVYVAASSLPKLIALWLGVIGLGAPLRYWLAPQARDGLVIQLGAGLGTMLMIDWLLAWAGWLNVNTAWLLCGAGFFILSWQMADPKRRQRWRPEHWPSPPWTLLLVLPVLGLIVVAATCPPGTLWAVEGNGYDVLSYHLQAPREWLDAGRMVGLKHNVYSYLPMLVEAGYMQIGAMQDYLGGGVYTAQLFHASTGVLAAVALSALVARWVGAAAGVLGGMTMLALPWTIVTGTLAYDEMMVLALGATALLVVFDPIASTWRGAAMAGVLGGWATLAKLPAGPMIAVPIVIIVLLRLNYNMRWPAAITWRRAASLAAVAAVAVALTLAPYLVRNIAWTGNPVFPMAANTLGRAHWDEALVQRWEHAHGRPTHPKPVMTSLADQWLLNVGYGTVGGAEQQRDPLHVARFDSRGGVPIFWLATLVGAILALAWPAARRITLAALVTLAVQVLFWLLLTHQQSRFLLPTLLPAGVVLGLGAGRVEQLLRPRSTWVFPVLGVGLLAALTVNSFATFFTQTPMSLDPQTGQRSRLAPWQCADSLMLLTDEVLRQGIAAVPGDHALNHLPPASNIYIVADNQSLLYIRGRSPGRFTYHSAFDPSPLGQIIRQQGDDAAKVTQALRDAGFTHVWVGWSELDRLQATYGYDPDVTLDRLRRYARARWRLIQNYRSGASLYALP